METSLLASVDDMTETSDSMGGVGFTRRQLGVLAALASLAAAIGEQAFTALPASAAGNYIDWPFPLQYVETEWMGYPNHRGMDFSSASQITGKPARVCADGVVTFAGYSGDWGNYVRVRHNVNGTNVDTAYAHLSRIDVQNGWQVTRGRQIGVVGSTGASTGPHLHFETWLSGERQNPRTVLAQYGTGVVVGEVSTMTPEQYNSIIAKQDEIIFWVKQLGEALLNGRPGKDYGDWSKRPVDLILDGVIETRARVRGDVSKNYDILQDILSKVSK